MRLKPRTREQAFAAVEALKDPGQKAYLVRKYDGAQAIRIRHHVFGSWYGNEIEITKPEQLEVKEYEIIA